MMHRLLLVRSPRHRPAGAAGWRGLSGGFQGPGGRGAGRSGGGKGDGGPHRTPKGPKGGAGDAGAFKNFLNKRQAGREAISADLDVARANTASELDAGGGGGGGGISVRYQTRDGGDANGGGNDAAGTGGRRRPGRADHRGGPPKENFEESVLRPAREGNLTPKHASGVPRLTGKRGKGNGVVRDEGLDGASGRPGARRSGRASQHGELARVVGGGGMADGTARDGEADDGLGYPSLFRARASGSESYVPPSPRLPRSQQRRDQLGHGGGRGGGRGRGRGGGRFGRGGGRGGRGRGGRGGRDWSAQEAQQAKDDANHLAATHLRESLVNHFSNVNNECSLEDGYDSDGDLEPVVKPGDRDHLDEHHRHVLGRNEDGTLRLDDEAADDEILRELLEEEHGPGQAAELYRRISEPNQRGRPRRFIRDDGVFDDSEDRNVDTYEYQTYLRDVSQLGRDPGLIESTDHPLSDAVLPIRPHGGTVDDFLFAANNHPSKFMSMERRVRHPDGERRARPVVPPGRENPSRDFAEGYRGFLYVSGLLPTVDDEGEMVGTDDPANRQTISERAAGLAGVRSTDVSPAGPTSAFVGFTTKVGAKDAMAAMVDEGRTVEHPVEIVEYELPVDAEIEMKAKTAEGEDSSDSESDGESDSSGSDSSSSDSDSDTDGISEADFVASAPGGAPSVVKLTGLPPDATPLEILRTVLPPGTPLEGHFGRLTADDVHRPSATTALVRLGSAKLASDMLKSKNARGNAARIGVRHPRVMRAKRERVFDRWAGVHGSRALSKLGPRLLVTGDLPPNEMYLSHHALLHLSGLPADVSLKDLARFFQPFSADRRDVLGSGHIVRCARGEPTGDAYVGFEMPGEAEEAIASLGGTASIGGSDVVLTAVADRRHLRGGVRETARPARTVDELRSDLDDWERHVDPADLAELEGLGVRRDVLDEVMRTLRHSNRTFAAADQAIAGERLYENHEPGGHYREVIQTYLDVVRSCAGTKEEPGLLYEAMFEPDMDVDTRLFDMEVERIAEQRKRGI